MQTIITNIFNCLQIFSFWPRGQRGSGDLSWSGFFAVHFYGIAALPSACFSSLAMTAQITDRLALCPYHSPLWPTHGCDQRMCNVRKRRNYHVICKVRSRLYFLDVLQTVATTDGIIGEEITTSSAKRVQDYFLDALQTVATIDEIIGEGCSEWRGRSRGEQPVSEKNNVWRSVWIGLPLPCFSPWPSTCYFCVCAVFADIYCFAIVDSPLCFLFAVCHAILVAIFSLLLMHLHVFCLLLANLFRRILFCDSWFSSFISVYCCLLYFYGCCLTTNIW